MKFIDIHSHLDICKNISEIIKICNEKNILIVNCGVDSKSNKKMLELKKEYPEMEICLGVYPVDSLKLSEKDLEKKRGFIKKNKSKILGIGEVGLDLHYEKSSEKFEIQKKNFGRFIELAKELKKPVFVHSRDAEKETIDFIEKFNYDKIVMHCFSGNMKLVKRIVENDWFLSIPSSVKYNKHFQEMIKIVPLENLFCETDAPFLHPDREKGMKNTPVNVLESYKKIAEIKDLGLDEVKEKVWNNFLKLVKFKN